MMTATKLRCPFCKSDAHLMDDTPAQRLHECRSCFAVNVVSKGNGGAWWYHGWEHPDGRRVNADGKASQRPSHMRFGWWDQC